MKRTLLSLEDPDRVLVPARHLRLFHIEVNELPIQWMCISCTRFLLSMSTETTRSSYLYLGSKDESMPHGQDVEDDTSEMASEYECLQCGRILKAETNPGECEKCGGDFQNRAKSVE